MNAKENFSNSGTWFRGAFMVLFGIVFYIAYSCLIWLLVLFQFVTHLLTGRPNTQLLELSPKITGYAHDILRYVTYQTNVRPWPLNQGSNGGADAPAAAAGSVEPPAPGPDPVEHGTSTKPD